MTDAREFIRETNVALTKADACLGEARRLLEPLRPRPTSALARLGVMRVDIRRLIEQLDELKGQVPHGA